MERKQWNDLSMTEKSEMMRMAVRNGITNLNDIRQAYNEFAEGGETDNHNENDNMSWLQKKAYNYMFGDLPVDTIRKRAYENMQPSYAPGNTLDVVHRIRNSIKKNNKEGASWLMADEERRRNYGDDLFAEYLQIPKKDRRQLNNTFYSKYTVEPSKYKPSKAKDNNEYKKLKIEYPIFGYGDVIKEFDKTDYPIKYLIENVLSGARSSSRKLRHLPLNPGETAHAKIIPLLGEHIVGRGYDSQGDYVSYYDLWDLAPSSLGGKADESFGIGKPFELYDRIYLDSYYGVPEQYRGGYYLPEVTVTPEKVLGGPLVQSAKKFENGGGFDEAINEIVKWNQTDPNTGERNPFYSREYDTYGTVELPEVDITEHWTPQGLRNVAAREGRQYMYDAQQQGYNVVGPLLSTLVSAPMDFYPIETLLTGFRRAGVTAQGNGKITQGNSIIKQTSTLPRLTSRFIDEEIPGKANYIKNAVENLRNKALKREPIPFAEKQAAAQRMEDFIHSPDYIQRQKKAGLSDTEIQKFQEMVSRRLDGGNFPAYFKNDLKGASGDAHAIRSKGIRIKKDIFQDLDKFRNVFDHEIAHYSTVGFTGNSDYNLMRKLLSGEDPNVVEKMLNYNTSVYPYRPKSDALQIRKSKGLEADNWYKKPEIQKNLDYTRTDQEVRANAYAVAQEARRRGVSIDELVEQYTNKSAGELVKGTPLVLNLLNYSFTPENIKKYVKGFLSASAPVGIGIYNNGYDNKKTIY